MVNHRDPCQFQLTNYIIESWQHRRSSKHLFVIKPVANLCQDPFWGLDSFPFTLVCYSVVTWRNGRVRLRFGSEVGWTSIEFLGETKYRGLCDFGRGQRTARRSNRTNRCISRRYAQQLLLNIMIKIKVVIKLIKSSFFVALKIGHLVWCPFWHLVDNYEREQHLLIGIRSDAWRLLDARYPGAGDW